MKHRAAELEKSLLEIRRSSSILLDREQRFARWKLGSAVWNPHCLNFTSAGLLTLLGLISGGQGKTLCANYEIKFC